MNTSRVVAVALLCVCASGALAQRPNRQMPGRGQGRGQDPRAQLEGDVRREFARVVRERVGLNDAQMEKLGPLTKKYEDQRRQTQVDERNARIRLQAALLDDNAADSAKVNSLVGQLMDIQKRRLTISEAEQKELGTIMSAHQRARFLGVQEQIRRRLEAARPFPGGPPPGDMPGDQPPPRAESAFVRLGVTPMRGAIVVDGVERGQGRMALALPVGWHRVSFSAVGCDPAQDSVMISVGSRPVLMKALTGKGTDCK